ncbi:uncharacterized protein LOC111627172 [Centruroides sculpturatus]|uniref:uncharacterized protein LOC111627172 n=1 Tax=Centruroides sculpturatus TaxID=218467 RepID=UPI000C6E1ADE|nr:uncharacterized protein LOC111627172 [Centruroides sculpturatus]
MSLITFNPYTVTQNFKKSGTFIPGIRPGQETEKYLTGIVMRLSVFSGFYLSAISAVPFIEQMIGIPQPFTISGTSLIILVSVAIETLEHVRARDTTQTISRAREQVLRTIDSDKDGQSGGLLCHISSGEIFRQAVRSGSELGKEIQATLAKGAYVDDKLTNRVIYQAIKSSHDRGQGVILDGYPRTLNQAHFLEDKGVKIDHVIWLDAPIEVIVSRLIGRGRADDSPDTIRQRIEVYRSQTQPLVDYYQAHKTVLKLDTSGSKEQNFRALIARLERD